MLGMGDRIILRKSCCLLGLGEGFFGFNGGSSSMQLYFHGQVYNVVLWTFDGYLFPFPGYHPTPGPFLDSTLAYGLWTRIWTWSRSRLCHWWLLAYFLVATQLPVPLSVLPTTYRLWMWTWTGARVNPWVITSLVFVIGLWTCLVMLSYSSYSLITHSLIWGIIPIGYSHTPSIIRFLLTLSHADSYDS